MEYSELLSKENLSTIFVWLWIIVGPYLVEYMDRDQFVALGVVLIGIIGAVYSSKHPNKLGILGNAPVPADAAEQVLNDEYECDLDDGC